MTVAVLAAGVAGLSARRSSLAAFVAVGLAVGALAAAWHVAALHRGAVPSLAARHADADVVVRLVRDPQHLTTAVGAPMTLVDATVTAVAAGGWRATNAAVLVLSFTGGWDGVLPGERVELTGRLSPPRSGDDVAAILDARSPPVAVSPAPWWQRLAARVRQGLESACAGLPVSARGLVPGLVDGDTDAEPPALRDDMRITGLTHLQAVSGENVGIVLGVVMGVARAVGLRRRIRIAVGLLGLLGFVVVAQPSPSVLRAAVMGALVLLALACGRRSSALPALAAAVLGLVCLDPFLARSVGFVLSVCATGAILTVAPRWTRRLERRLPRPLAAAIAVPAAAQLACTPVLVLAFGQLAPYAIPANLFAAPAVAPATVLGVTCAVFAAVSTALARPWAWAAALPAEVIATVAHALASLPAAGLRWPGGAGLDLVTTSVVVLLVIRRRRRRGSSSSRDILGACPP